MAMMNDPDPLHVGGWFNCEERQPEKRGAYTVRRRSYGRRLVLDVYRWNGAYWVTRGGSPTDAVEYWWEPAVEEEETHGVD